jgi:hypothetical protein
VPQEARRLRPQSGKPSVAEAASEASPVTSRKRKIAILAGASALVATVAVLAMHQSSPPPGAETKTAPAAVAALAPEPKSAASPQAAPALLAAPAGKRGVSADVPLFGPTELATAEPAPLGAPPEELEAAGLAPSKAASSNDESWSKEDRSDDEAETTNVKPQDVKPWGRGKVKAPAVLRLRLDAPGAAIQGHPDPTGFTVLIPGRKLMESGSVLAKRDSRIARVRTQSTAAGAEITFRFKDGVPGYRVRLRKDFVEFMVSAADEAKRTGAASTTKSKDSAKDSSGSNNNKKKRSSESRR